MRRVNLVAQSPVRERVDFTFGVQMPLRKLMQAYADYFEIDRNKLIFRISGRLVGDSDTPELLHLANGCVIQVTDNLEANIENIENTHQVEIL